MRLGVFIPVACLSAAFMIFGTTGFASETKLPDSNNHQKNDGASEKAQSNKKDSEAEKILERMKPWRRKMSSYQVLPGGNNQPWKLVRKLQKFQDKIVDGQPNALDEYRKLLNSVSKQMLASEPEVWSHERNLDAVTLFVLVGGNPAIGRLALAASNLPDAAKHPLKTAIAYGEKDVNAAFRMTKDFDPNLLPASLSGQFALMTAMVMSSIDLKLAVKHLNIARLLAPGTLIEEAAIRRHLRISGRNKEVVKFFSLSSIYKRRFIRSHFINDYLRSYGLGLVQMPNEIQAQGIKDMKSLLELLDDNKEMILLSFVARNAAILGKTELGYWAATQALDKMDSGSNGHDQLKLYAVATGLVSKTKYENSLELLRTIDSDTFNADDQKLFRAVNALSRRLNVKAMEVEEVVNILSDKNQIFPGETVPIPLDIQQQYENVKSNPIVARFENISLEFEEVIGKANQ